MKKSLLILALPLLATAFSCNKFEDFGDTNVNPGATNDPVVGALLTNVEAGIGGFASSTRDGYYSQYFSETQYSDASLYSLPQIEFAGTYTGSLYDLENIIIQNKGNNQNAVARILKAYIYWTTTDRWGDIPYSEALQGNPTPKYDSQESIYKGIIAELTAAVAQFDAISSITGDVSSYAGDVDSWKKLANSLRLLMALRLSNKFPDAGGYAATEFNAALAADGGVIEDNSANYTVSFPGGNFKSPWYALYDGRKDVGESAPMVNLMTSLGDSRQEAFASDINGDPTTVGVPYGWKRENVDPWTAANPDWAYVLAEGLRAETGDVVIVSASQVLLARAEAADRGWTSEDAATLYADGIYASFEQWGVDAPADSYFTQPNVAFAAAPGTGANVSKIAIQRYIATYPDGLQGWAEQRRTGVPALVPAPDAVGEVVTRYVYGPNEYGSNKASVEAAAGALPGGDKQNSKVWWDQ